MRKYCTKNINNQTKLNRLKYVIRINPGKFSKTYTECIPLGILLKMYSGQNTSTIKKDVKQGIYVNSKKIKSINYPIAPLDIVTYKGQPYRVILNKKYNLEIIENPCLYHKIIQVLNLKNNKFQINMFGGYNYVCHQKLELNLYDYVLKRELSTNTVSFVKISNCNTLVVIKGKYKNLTFKEYKLDKNNVIINEGVINKDYCLFYES